MIVQIKNRLLAARSRQKSYADVRRKPLEFEILSRIGPVAYKLDLPQELHGIHNTFHVSNLKKYLADEVLVIPLDEVKIDDKLHFIEEPVEIMDREVKKLKQSWIPIVKVRWNSKRRPEYTWEREDQIFGVDAAMKLEEKHQVFNVAGEELSAAKHKLMLLDIVAEGRLMLLSQAKTVNEKCYC
nr:putative reverse transcriptase domain-containing protein [Tanacetum cinerariifolium]